MVSKGQRALGRIRVFLIQNCKHWKQDVGYIEEELKDYSEIKEIAKHYHWDDFVKDTHMVDTDEKYLRLFDAAIPGIQVDYRKARAFEVVGKYVGVEFSRTSAGNPVMWLRNKRFGQGWFIHISEEDYESVGDTNKEGNR